MIVKILNSASREFNGVRYNDKKIENGSGELMLMKNFPSTINEESSQKEVKDYLKSVSKSNRVKKPQFHAVISTKFREHSKEELAEIAEKFMQEMGYGEQPYIAVFHNDTENNHIHIVSTRVDKSTGKKIDDSFEKLKSQKALQKVLGNQEMLDLDKLLNYRYGSLNQLKLLLERNDFKVLPNKENEDNIDILKNGVVVYSLKGNQIQYSDFDNRERKKQIRAILRKYSEQFSNKVFKVVDDRHKNDLLENAERKRVNENPKIEFESELQQKMRTMFGIDIVFHFKDDKQPFGYSLIDNKTKQVFKGSEILKMKEIFEMTQEQLDKQTFERLKDFNISNAEEKKVLLVFLNEQNTRNPIKDYMLFENKKKVPIEAYREVRQEAKEFIKNPKNDTGNIHIVKGENGKYYTIHSAHHQIWELEKLVGEKDYKEFLNPNLTQYKNDASLGDVKYEFIKGIEEIGNIMLKPNYTAKDPAEDELKKRKKKRRR